MENKNSGSIDYAFALYKNMQRDNLGYIYRGRFTQNITDNILSLTETSLQKEEQSHKIKKRVYSIMVECLQNITRHQDDTDDHSTDSYGIFVIQKESDKYFITTGNLVYKENIEVIKNLIDKINSLEKEELKTYYKQVLDEGTLSQKGGAGLGLIDMARKSGNKLSYEFKSISEEFAYFYLHTIPSLEEFGSAADIQNKESLGNIIDIHTTLNEQNILLVFNGILNQESLLSLLSSLEGQMMTGPELLRKKVFYIVVEILQNIVKHADSKNAGAGGNPGLFMIGERDGGYFITTGNFIHNSKVDAFRKKLEDVNVLDKKELDKKFDASLLNFEIDDCKKSGLGIMDLRIKSGNKLNFSFHDDDESYKFFSLQTVVSVE